MKHSTHPAFRASLAQIPIHVLRLRSAAGAQMNNRAVFSTSPTLSSIRKRETEQRDLRDRSLFCPGITTIGGPIDHASFPHDPSGLRVGKTHPQEVGQLRAGTGTGQRAIDPLMTAICRVEDGAGIPDGPPGRRIGKVHIK